MMLQEDQIDEAYIQSAKAFHYGTLSMTHEGVRKATYKAINVAKEAGLLISFDPIRDRRCGNLWKRQKHRLHTACPNAIC